MGVLQNDAWRKLAERGRMPGYFPVLTTLAAAGDVLDGHCVTVPVSDTDLAFFAGTAGNDGQVKYLTKEQAVERDITNTDILSMADGYLHWDDFRLTDTEWRGRRAVRIRPKNGAGLYCICNPYALDAAKARLTSCFIVIDRDSVLCVQGSRGTFARALQEWIRDTGSEFPSVYAIRWNGTLRLWRGLWLL